MLLLAALLTLLIPILIVMKANSRAYLIFGRRTNPGIVQRFGRSPGIMLANGIFIASFQIITICFYAMPAWSKANPFPVFVATGLGCAVALIIWAVAAARFYEKWKENSGD